MTKDFIESALDKKKNFNIKETLQNIIKDEVALQYTKDLLGTYIRNIKATGTIIYYIFLYCFLNFI